MSTSDNSSIEQQKREVSAGSNTVKLESSCVIGNGIVQLSEEEKQQYQNKYKNWEGVSSFFIPASGSGSRMFAELANFIQTKEETEVLRQFFEKLPEMALFNELPVVVREKYDDLQHIYIAEYLLSSEGLQLQGRPKGLIPFHITANGILNPFQDQLKQALSILGNNGKVEFTVQQKFENSISKSLSTVSDSDVASNVTFSYQNAHSNAYCFDENGELMSECGEPLRRPSGHGALLENLNAMDSDLIFIKNIDNVQHPDRAAMNEHVWKYCAGLLLEFKDALKDLSENFSRASLKAANQKFQFLSEGQAENCDAHIFQDIIAQPSRVCGMVVNEGAPGGGPFWINDDGVTSKQIVEKVQISESDKAIVEESSHFNPVFIALSKTDTNGNELDLQKFVDRSKYLVVNKPHEHQRIQYRELPGLWNGSMHHWNTVFVEIPKEVFSPVKSVFDLMKEAHRPRD